MASPLDLDVPGTWNQDFESLVYEQETWSQIEAKLDVGRVEHCQFVNSFLEQITYGEESLRDDLARSLREKGKEILFRRHASVTAYHGCRPSSITSYRENGILPSDTQKLIGEARALFTGIDGFDAALVDIGHSYMNYNESKVGLLVSARRAKEDRSSYINGSELIRGIASRLGLEAKARVIRTGTPTLIKCLIPVTWLDTQTTFPASGIYVKNVLNELICRRYWPGESFPGCPGGFYLTRAVPSQNIVDFIDMTEFSDQESWLREQR